MILLSRLTTQYLLSNFASLIQLQKINEVLEDRSLLASPFMKSLVALSEVFSLDKVFSFDSNPREKVSDIYSIYTM